LNINIQQHCS